MKLLISDFEGTLVDFQWKLKESINEMCQIIKGYNINYHLNLPIERLKKFDYAKLYNYFQKNIDDPHLKNKIMADFDRVYDFFDLDAVKRWKIHNNAEFMLKNLKDNNVKMALCSNVGTKALEIVLEKFKLPDYFDFIITRDNVKYLKPNLEGIRKILNFFKIKRDENNSVFFLGDSITDIKTAKRARIPSIIIVGDGENSFSEIYSHKPNHIVNDLKDVLKFL